MVNHFLPGMSEQHRVTLAYMLTGILESNQVQLKEMADAVKYPHKTMSLADRFRRFLRNDQLVIEAQYLPFVQLILSALSRERLVLAIDTTPIGGGCLCLMVSVLYKSRALPLCWIVFKGKKGHSSVQLQLQLLQQVQALVPETSQVILLGDGEFDASQLIDWLQQQPNWHYVCRTATKLLVQIQGQWRALQELLPAAGQEAFLSEVRFTRTDQIGPLNVLIVWHAEKQEHWCFVTNFTSPAEAKKWYRKRFAIETLFSDVKGRGFHLDKTRLFQPERVRRLILVTAIAYLFTVFLGVELIVSGPLARLVRTDAFYHSLFRLGRTYLKHLLNECLTIPMLRSLYPPSSFEHVVL